MSALNSTSEHHVLVPIVSQPVPMKQTPHDTATPDLFSQAARHGGRDVATPQSMTVICETAPITDIEWAMSGSTGVAPATAHGEQSNGDNTNDKQDAKLRISPAVMKPHLCYLCPMMFNAPSHLEDHLRSHTKESPFQCTHCYKRFTVKRNLYRHVRQKHS
ncbi:uncharacterized protein LOC142557126 isoform X2 [Dermacentor variabilis]